MDYVYAVTTAEEFTAYQSYAGNIHSKLRSYLLFLEKEYHVHQLPKCIVFAGAETASHRISTIPLPGYTNEHRTVFCPDASVWKTIYLKQLEGAEPPEIRRYYETLGENNILQILGHEFVHHSDLSIDEAYEKARWFEEGMCEYISRKYFLTAEEFQEEARINALLVTRFEARHGVQPLENFCAGTYSESLAAIFCFYWKSFLAVNSLVERFDGNVTAVFRAYRQWYDTAAALPLSEWFHV